MARRNWRAVLNGFRVNRALGEGIFPLNKVFTGFEGSPALSKIFGGPLQADLEVRKVGVMIVNSPRGYMRVSDEDGKLIVNRRYLKTGNRIWLYLDLIHELTHVRQFHQGLDIYDDRYEYVDRPTEIEAYRMAVEEARRLGLSEEEIEEYLKVEWVSSEEHERLVSRVFAEGSSPTGSPAPS